MWSGFRAINKLSNRGVSWSWMISVGAKGLAMMLGVNMAFFVAVCGRPVNREGAFVTFVIHLALKNLFKDEWVTLDLAA